MKLNLLIVTCFFISVTATAADEHWSVFHVHKFSLGKSLFRNQGVATDEQGHFWYSSTQGLMRASSKWGGAVALRVFPIPHHLMKQGDNHIGCLDVYDGHIFAPIEDGPHHLHPHIGIYNARTLKFEKEFGLPWELQPDGVPWVAVDKTNGLIYSSVFHGATKLNVYSPHDLSLMKRVSLSMPVSSIQGAKVRDGAMYMTANGQGGQGFALYKIDLASGHVSVVGRFPQDVIEVEGLTFSGSGDQLEIDALGVVLMGGFIAHKVHLPRLELVIFKRD